jgi:HAD superfamily hydrolase (TIGR01509 family)
MIEAILWDNDGVLVDTEHLYFEATQQVLQSVGIPLSEAQYIELFLVQGKGAWHLAEAQGARPIEVERLRSERDAAYVRLLRQGPRVLNGVACALDALHQKYVMGIVTSSKREHFDLIHASTGLLPYFDFVLASGDYARSKPDPDPYLAAITCSGVAPEACVAIEDSERGLASATRAGIRCIVVPSRLTRGRAFAGAHRVLESASDIPAALQQPAMHSSPATHRLSMGVDERAPRT